MQPLGIAVSIVRTVLLFRFQSAYTPRVHLPMMKGTMMEYVNCFREIRVDGTVYTNIVGQRSKDVMSSTRTGVTSVSGPSSNKTLRPACSRS